MKTKSIVKNLTENYAVLQAHYQAAYLGWWGNPCSKEAEKAYNDAKALICEKELSLKKIELDTKKMLTEIKLKTKEKPSKKKEKKGKKGAEITIQPILGDVYKFVTEYDIDFIAELVSKLKI